MKIGGKTSPQVSIIVSAYNIENYIENCLESILKQSYQDFELIVVDDGSTDDTFMRCNKYVQYNDKIKLIHQENAGLSAARNAGLSVASGNYITFIDGDDYIEKDFLSKVSYYFDKADLIITNYMEHHNDGSTRIGAYNVKRGYQGDVLYYTLIERIPLTVWGKFYKRSLIYDDKNEYLSFPIGRRYEDTLFSLKCIYYSRLTSIVDDAYYFYVQRGNSITHKPQNGDIDDLLQNVKEIEVLFKEQCVRAKEVYVCTVLLFALELAYQAVPQYDANIEMVDHMLRANISKVPIIQILKCRRWKHLLMAKVRLHRKFFATRYAHI